MKSTTLNEIKKRGPCASGWAKLLAGLGKTGADDEPLSFIRILEINGIDDAIWALRTQPQLAAEYAIECAESVLSVFESKFPDDDRPRKAIEAAKSGGAARAAAYAADAAGAADAACAACAAYAADAADAADAAYAAAYAAYAARAAAYAADAADAAAAAYAACAAYAADAADAAAYKAKIFEGLFGELQSGLAANN